MKRTKKWYVDELFSLPGMLAQYAEQVMPERYQMRELRRDSPVDNAACQMRRRPQHMAASIVRRSCVYSISSWLIGYRTLSIVPLRNRLLDRIS